MVFRNKNLDVLRAVAVLMTFGRHMSEPRKTLPGGVYYALHAWFKTGWAGVALFFVLSGFLVSSLMFNEFSNSGTIRFGRFYIRRGLKIYPSFYAMLACSILLGWLGLNYFQRDLVPPGRLNGHTILSEVFFLQNYLGYIWVHVWSLAVEEHFYLLLGLVVFLVLTVYPHLKTGVAARDRFAPMPWLCLLMFVAAFVLRWEFLQTPRTIDELFKGTCYTHLRIDSLFFGVLLAYYVKFRAETFLVWVKAHTWWLLCAGLVLVAPSLKFEETDEFMFLYGLSMMYVGFGGLLLFVLYHGKVPSAECQMPSVRSRLADLLAYIGQNSYSIYLWHLPVMYLIGLALPAETNAQYYFLIAVQNVAGLAAGLVMAKLIEMPVLRVRDRFFAGTNRMTNV